MSYHHKCIRCCERDLCSYGVIRHAMQEAITSKSLQLAYNFYPRPFQPATQYDVGNQGWISGD